MKKIFFGSVAMLLAVGGGLFLRSWLDRRPVAAASAPEAVDHDHGDDVAELRDEVRSLRRQMGQVAGATLRPQPPAAAPAEEPKKPRTDAEIRAAEYEHSAHIASYSNAYFDREQQDPTWGVEREREITQSFGALKVPGFAFEKAECRTTICRIVLERSPDAATQPLGPAIADLAPFRKMGAFFHYEADKVVLFAPREGHDYPSDPSLAQQ